MKVDWKLLREEDPPINKGLLVCMVWNNYDLVIVHSALLHKDTGGAAEYWNGWAIEGQTHYRVLAWTLLPNVGVPSHWYHPTVDPFLMLERSYGRGSLTPNLIEVLNAAFVKQEVVQFIESYQDTWEVVDTEDQ